MVCSKLFKRIFWWGMAYGLVLFHTGLSHAKDNVYFDCTAIGLGYQTDDYTGPWEFEIGDFVWRYDASMIELPPKVDGAENGCMPAEVKSPEIDLGKGRYVYISANRCGGSPSYFFAVTTLDGISVSTSLGYYDDLLRGDGVRVVFNNEDGQMKIGDKEFGQVSFDCSLGQTAQ